MKFYLGTPEVSWLARTETKHVPLCVARPRLAARKSLPQRPDSWARPVYDSGGYNELLKYGTWSITPQQYLKQVRRFIAEIGQPDWVAPMDWICTPEALARTGLTVAEHQQRTLHNVLTLRDLDDTIPWLAPIQGHLESEYHRHADAYARAGIDLTDPETHVGIGGLAARQHTVKAALIVSGLAQRGIRAHAFGFKFTGLKACAPEIASSDSMSWVTTAKRQPARPGCTHRQCGNCLPWALEWRTDLLDAVRREHPALALDEHTTQHVGGPTGPAARSGGLAPRRPGVSPHTDRTKGRSLLQPEERRHHLNPALSRTDPAQHNSGTSRPRREHDQQATDRQGRLF